MPGSWQNIFPQGKRSEPDIRHGSRPRLAVEGKEDPAAAGEDPGFGPLPEQIPSPSKEEDNLTRGDKT